MEHVRIRDNNSSPRPTEDPAAPLIQEDPSLLTQNWKEYSAEDAAWPSPPPSTANFQYADESRPSSRQSLHPKLSEPKFELPRSKPLFRGFERPSFSRIAILTIICIITYPAFYILTLVAMDRSLFIVRAIVSVWCSGVGFALGYILLKIGAQYLEAATWATVIHMSHEGGGMQLRDLARSSRNPTSFLPAFHVFRSRFRNREVTSGRSRKSYDKRPWPLFLGFFLILAILAPLLPFLFGRIMRIETFVRNQRKTYHEVLVAGDLSEDDVNQATTQFNEFRGFAKAWTLLPYGGSAFSTAEFAYGEDTVYFAQPIPSQFIPGGSGAGAFHQPASMGPKDTPNNTLLLTGRNTPKSNTGVVLRYPQWGLRIHCEKLPDPQVNLVPDSSQNFTYAFIPQNFLRGLFGEYGMELPTPFEQPDFSGLYMNDTRPSNIDSSTISYVAGFPDDHAAIGIHSILYPESPPTDYQGWTAIETYMIRLNVSLAPSSRFPVYSNESLHGMETRRGHDTAVCLHRYEPWIMETYNTSIVSPSSVRIVEKAGINTSMSPSGNIRGAPIANTRYLNTTGKTFSFFIAQANGINTMWKDNDRTANYVPSPTVISFTDGTGPSGYTELSSGRLAVVRARVGAANSLPYLVGSAPIVAQAYADETLAYVTYEQWELISLPILVLILGIIGEMFVPTLPLDVPRREFGVYSWLALFQSQELRFEAADDLHKFMSLDELEEGFSDRRVKFIV